MLNVAEDASLMLWAKFTDVKTKKVYAVVDFDDFFLNAPGITEQVRAISEGWA